jgi:(2Fe-2S) ferredoxin
LQEYCLSNKVTAEMKYDKHIFICTNQRPDGAPRPCCGEGHGIALVTEFKREIKNKNLNAEIRAQRTGCFDLCESGPMVVVYPEGVFYGKVQLEDVKEIVDSHIEGGLPVKRLMLEFPKA